MQIGLHLYSASLNWSTACCSGKTGTRERTLQINEEDQAALDTITLILAQ
jgi:hypothetical protein